MGVYINMEMPKSCPECPLADEIVHCPLTGKTYNWGLIERASDCPLVNVPPHGRLIDADAVERNLLKIQQAQTGPCSHGVRKSRAVLRDAPTIIPADHIVDATKMVNAEEAKHEP